MKKIRFWVLSFLLLVGIFGILNEKEVYADTTYRIVFDANGGTGTLPSNITKTLSGNTVSFGDITREIPQRTGYIFYGWSSTSSTWSQNRIAYSSSYGGGTAPDNSKAQTTSGSWSFADYCSYTGASTSITTLYLYAQWVKPITITYHANGGSGAPSTQTEYLYNSDTRAYFSLSTTTPSYGSYEFAGWSTNASGSGNIFSAGASVNASGNANLYAMWNKTITIHLNPNGGESTKTVSTYTLPITRTDPNLIITSITPTRTGYTFAGWANSPTASYATYSPGNAYRIYGDMTLYAVWVQGTVSQKTYTIRFNNNGGTGGSLPEKRQSIAVNSSIGMGYLQSYQPVKTDYTFLGWSASTNYRYKGKRISYHSIKAPDGTYSTEASTSWTYADYCSYTGGNALTPTLVLYAQWAKPVTLTYNANGGSGAPSPQTSYMYNSDSSCSMGVSGTVPKRSGYTFLGWSASSTATRQTYQAGGSYNFNASMTLYAVWKANPNPSTPVAPVENKMTQFIAAGNLTKYQHSKAFSFSLNASALDFARLSYSSNNSKIKVNNNGTVTVAANYTGSATITIRCAETTRYKAGTKTIKVTVKKPSLSLSKTSLTMVKGKSATLKVKRTGISSKIKWISSNKKIVTINSKGKLLAKKIGKAKITVTCGRLKKVCNIKVVKKKK